MDGSTRVTLEVPGPKGAECPSPQSCASGPYDQVEALREALQQEWVQFAQGLERAASQQLFRQEELIASCLRSISSAPAQAQGFHSKPRPTPPPLAPIETEPRGLPRASTSDSSNLFQSEDTAIRSCDRTSSGMPRLRSSPTKYQDLVHSKQLWHDQRSFIRRVPQRFSRIQAWFEELHEPPRSSRLAHFVRGRFERICICVIIFNAALSAVALNHEVDTLSTESTPFMRDAEIFFVAFYTVELALKLAVHRLYYFCNKDMTWNIFDAALVLFSLVDQALTIIIESNDSIDTNFTFMRILKLLKIARVLRGLRVMRFFSALRLILNSLIGSFSSLMWSIVMLSLIFYIFALVFVQGAASYLIEEGADEETAVTRELMLADFGSVQTAVLSLFKACTSGDDWRYIMEAIQPAGFMYAGLFLFFIAFSQIALLNILTALFVQRALKLAQPDRETHALIERAKEIDDVEELRRILHEADRSQSGRLSGAEFCAEVKRGKLGAQLAALGLNVKDAPLFFGLVAQGEADSVEVNEFVERCMRMRGGASCIEMYHVNQQLLGIQEAQLDLQGHLSQVMRLMATLVKEHFPAAPPPPPTCSSPRSFEGAKLRTSI